MSLAQVVSTMAAAVLSLWGTAQLKRRDRPEMLWGEGHMNSVEIHRPLYAVILAKALSCLQDAKSK